MRQKKTLLILALSLFVLLLTNAYADDFDGVNLFLSHVVYDSSFFSTPENKSVMSAAFTESNSSAVRVQFNAGSYDPNMNSLTFLYLDQWSKFLPWNLYSQTNPYPLYAGELTQNAYFFIDGNSNGKWDNSEPFSSILSSGRPTGTYNFLDAASNVQITGGIYPTITWDPVTGAEKYRVGIVGFNPDGTPNLRDLKFITGFLPSDSYSYAYTGDLFKNGESYAIFVEARDYLGNDPSDPFVNQVSQSRYLTEYTPVPEPTTMLLLGSGLIGLAGYGRKKFFKK